MLPGGAEFVARMRRLAHRDEKEQSALRELRLRTSLEQVVAAVEEQKGENWAQWRDRHGDWGAGCGIMVGKEALRDDAERTWQSHWRGRLSLCERRRRKI